MLTLHYIYIYNSSIYSSCVFCVCVWQDMVVSSLARAPTNNSIEGPEWLESPDDAWHAQKSFLSSNTGSASRSGNGSETESDGVGESPVVVMVTASVRPDDIIRSFNRSSSSSQRDQHHGRESDNRNMHSNSDDSSSSSSNNNNNNSSKSDEGVHFLRACSSVPLFHTAGTM